MGKHIILFTLLLHIPVCALGRTVHLQAIGKESGLPLQASNAL